MIRITFKVIKVQVTLSLAVDFHYHLPPPPNQPVWSHQVFLACGD